MKGHYSDSWAGSWGNLTANKAAKLRCKKCTITDKMNTLNTSTTDRDPIIYRLYFLTSANKKIPLPLQNTDTHHRYRYRNEGFKNTGKVILREKARKYISLLIF